MRVILLAAMLAFGGPALASEQGQEQGQEQEPQQASHDEIVRTVQKYLDGTQYGRPELVEEAFLPSLEVQWLDETGAFRRRPGPEYIARINPGVEVPRYGRIVSVDVTDNAAMVKAEITWNNRIYTDYMLLLKVEGSWKVSNKIATWRDK